MEPSCKQVFLDRFQALSSAEAPVGYPNKNSNDRKAEGARGAMGRGKKPRSLSLLFPSPLARFLFLSPQPPYQTNRPLWRREFPRNTKIFLKRRKENRIKTF